MMLAMVEMIAPSSAMAPCLMIAIANSSLDDPCKSIWMAFCLSRSSSLFKVSQMTLRYLELLKINLIVAAESIYIVHFFSIKLSVSLLI